VKLHAETAGSGPALVLVHGWGLHSGIWTALMPELVRRFRVTRVDLPGHGLSRSEDCGFSLEAAAEDVAAVAPRGAAWLGWSLGGQVVLAAAAAGWRIPRLVLVATTPRFVAGPDWPCGMAAEALADFAAALAQDYHKTVRDFLTLQLRGDRQAATLLAELRRILAEREDPSPGALRAGLSILADTDLRALLPAIDQPALVVAGERDRLTPAEAGRQLAAALPAARFRSFPDAAHAPFLTHPEAFVAAVAGFLADSEAGA
jgi:pimeloyl-[acyl-carrier protein] methyl ester esterase